MNRLFTVSILFGVIALTSDLYAEPMPQMVVTPIEEAKFVPIDPSRPDGAQMAVLWGDPQTGPSSMLLKFGRSSGRLHVHSSDYHLVTLEGTMKHWTRGQSEADAKPLAPGSFWFQPGNQAHADSCLSEKCVMFVQWAGKRDTRLARAASSNAQIAPSAEQALTQRDIGPGKQLNRRFTLGTETTCTLSVVNHARSPVPVNRQ